MQEELAIHAHATGDGPQEISDTYLEETASRFRDFANLSEAQWSENEVSLLAEMRKARRDQLKAFPGVEMLVTTSVDNIAAGPLSSPMKGIGPPLPLEAQVDAHRFGQLHRDRRILMSG